MTVWLDDKLESYRPAPAGWVGVKTAQEAIALLRTGKVEELSLDNDLGDEAIAGSGFDVLEWLETETAMHGFVPPPTIVVHGADESVYPKMLHAISNIARLSSKNLARSRHLVAILDDDEAFVSLLKELLEFEGYDSVSFVDKAKFLDSIDVVRPDVIVTDVKSLDMSMDGMEFLKRIKTDRVHSSIPVIMGTGLESAVDRAEALRLGAFAWIQKPFPLADLIRTLQISLKTA